MGNYIKGLLMAGFLYYIGVLCDLQALILLSYCTVVVMVLSVVYLCMVMPGMKCRVEVPITMTQQGENLQVQLHKIKAGNSWAGKVVFYITIENTWNGEKRILRQIINGGGEHTFQLMLQEAGYYEISLKKVRIYDWFGMFGWSKKVREMATVVVLPEVYPTNIRVTDGVRNFVGDADVYDTVKSGDDAGEILKLRPFRDGDKLRNIHWKLSAKADELIVRENSMPKACSTVLMLERVSDKSADRFIKAVASLSFSLMDMDCPHFIAWYSKRYQDVVRIRVDGEAGFYEGMIYLLQDFDRRCKIDIRKMYQEKYRAEVLLHYLLLTEKLQIWEKDELVCRLQGTDVEKALSEMELIL
ncbi:MAG: DUF58 domain-containing protein [Lachnospiraceae bacterium]|nr:DUF58 domain-containing protein [Lachnospiraceae bacterium]